jgi:hypothetical protein
MGVSHINAQTKAQKVALIIGLPVLVMAFLILLLWLTFTAYRWRAQNISVNINRRSKLTASEQVT